MSRADATHAYVARMPECRCLVAAIVAAIPGDKVWQKEVSKEVGKWIRDGLIVERVPNEQVRVEFCECVHQKKPETMKLPGFE